MVVKFMDQWLQKNPEQEGVHFSDIFSYYVYSVTAKPRRHLADWLTDYFFQTETGTYRLPPRRRSGRSRPRAGPRAPAA